MFWENDPPVGGISSVNVVLYLDTDRKHIIAGHKKEDAAVRLKRSNLAELHLTLTKRVPMGQRVPEIPSMSS